MQVQASVLQGVGGKVILKQPIGIELEEQEGGWSATIASAPSLSGMGRTRNEAMLDLSDIVGKVAFLHQQGKEIDDAVSDWLRENVVGADGIAPVAGMGSAPAARSEAVQVAGKKVWVLTKDGKVGGVTTSQEWAERWEKWAQGTAIECELDKLP